MKDVVKTILLLTAVMILLRWADGTSTQMARKSTSGCDGIMSIFWTEDDQTKLEKYVREERKWEKEHDDHFLESLGL